MSEPSLEEMSGERQSSPSLKVNEITINGQTGQIRFRDVLGGLIEDGEKKRYAEKDLGKEVEVVFLKIRRKLMAHQEGKRPLATNEHNAKTDNVLLFGDESGIKKGTADELRAMYPNLKTVQVVYAIYEGELVRVFIKGSSLGSKSKENGVHDFYSYVSSFKKNGRSDHFYECFTKLQSRQEKGKLGPYYCFTYVEGDKLSAEHMELVKKHMATAFQFSKEVDEYYGKSAGKSESVLPKYEAPEEDDESGEEEYGEEEINPEDIPF